MCRPYTNEELLPGPAMGHATDDKGYGGIAQTGGKKVFTNVGVRAADHDAGRAQLQPRPTMLTVCDGILQKTVAMTMEASERMHQLVLMFHQFVVWMAHTVGQWGYPGIVVLMALESSFFPFPSEVVIPPAAYLAATTGEMSLPMVILSGILGSLVGAVFNYWLALRFGRPLFERYGRYLLISHSALEKADRFFERHGHISTFIGRLLPGIRQYISLPAGLARMNLPIFSIATALGAGIWVAVLAAAGYWFGRNEQMIMANMHWVTLALVAFCSVIALLYWWHWKKGRTSQATAEQA